MQERLRDGRGEVVEQLHGGREHQRQVGVELLDERDPRLHQVLAGPDGRPQRDGLGRVGLEGPEPMAVGAQSIGQDIRVRAIVLVARQAVPGAERLDVPARDDRDREARSQQRIDDRPVRSLDGHAIDVAEPPGQLPEPRGIVIHVEARRHRAPLVDDTHRVRRLRPVDAGEPAGDTIHACLLAVAAAWGHPSVKGRVRRSLTDRRSMARSPIAARHVPARRTPQNSVWPSNGERHWRWSGGHRVHQRLATRPGCRGPRAGPGRADSETWPSMTATLWPPIQVSAPSRSTKMRPARPIAVPCAAT